MLRFGVLTAAFVAAVGGALFLAQHGREPVHYAAFRGEPPELSSLVGILRGSFHLEARALTQLGLLLLIATPVARVALSLVGFFMERDRKYQAITLLVLAILLASLFGRI
ncbi:MAG TPA: DUF1634 domain-containing protein [Gemmatimonadales bacterium]|nr:DUF1634 domain-containing protein [Gemmatimonadales bacterium]